MEKKFGKLSFVKLLNLTFDEQNQVVKYITDKIEVINNLKQIESGPLKPANTIEIPELKMIKGPKPKLSLIHPDIFINPNEAYMTSQAVKIKSFNSSTIKMIQEYNQAKINEIKEVKEKSNIFKLMGKCIPSIFKKVKKVKNN